MPTTTVWNDGAPPGALVTAQLLLGDVTTANRVAIAQLSTTVDVNGRWQFDLASNNEVTPTGSWWEIVEPKVSGDPTIWDVYVPGRRTVTFFGQRVTQLPANTAGRVGVGTTVVVATATHTTALMETTICTSGTFVDTLPAPTANGDCMVVNTGSGSITVHGASGTLYSLTGGTGDQTLTQGQGHKYKSDGTNWYAVS